MEDAKKLHYGWYIRCTCGPKLSVEQFRKMTWNYLRLESYGMYCELYDDWTPDKGYFWDTNSVDSETVLRKWTMSSLERLARRYLAENKVDSYDTKNLSDYVTFTIIKSEYVPKDKRRAMSST